jgi:predicted CXXCH cytochrome family protein
MSEWCESCHSTISDNTNKHPAGASDGLLNQTAGTSNTMFYNYNRYIETGDLGGDVSTSYLALVPFEIGAAATRTDLLARSESTEGPDGASNVMCLTCHRAHASAFNNIMRWDSEEELLIDSMPDATQLAGMGVTDPTAPYYGKVIGAGGDFGEFQRSLCNKCHVND